ncbi:MAG: hypothetical protein U0795_01520 [Pirellulales bacterium]
MNQLSWYRRLLQVRLGTLLVIFPLAAGLLAWVASERRESRRQLDVARAFEKSVPNGYSSHCTFGGPYDKCGVSSQTWWRQLAEVTLGARVTEIDVSALSTEQLKLIGELPDVVKLTVDVGPDLKVELTPLARLTKLQSLSILSAVRIGDLSPLAGLSRLETLTLWVDASKDLSPLASLSRLRSLELVCDGPNVDIRGVVIAPLANLSNLRELWIKGPVFDLTPLAELNRLNKLTLFAIETDDLTPLANLRRLVYLEITNCPVFDLRPIAKLENLERLELLGTGVVDLSSLQPLARLTRLKISSTAISDLSPILGLSNLRELIVADYSNIDAAELEPFSKALPNCKVVR